MKRYLGFSVFLILTHCSFFHKDPIVLQINSKSWTSKEFAKLLKQKTKHFSAQDIQNNNVLKKIKEQIIGDLIIKEITINWAKKNNITISDKELSEAIKKISSRYPTEEAFNLYLKKINIDKKQWKTAVKYNLLSKKVIHKIQQNIVLPPLEELKKYYQTHLSLFKTPAKLLIRHFFHQQKDIAQKVQAQIKESKNFKTLTERFSQAPSQNQVTWIKKGEFSVFDKAFVLKKGDISSVLPSIHGYHIIEVLEKKASKNLSFNQAKSQIIKKLKLQKQKALFKEWLDKQEKTVYISKNTEILNKIKIKPL